MTGGLTSQSNAYATSLHRGPMKTVPAWGRRLAGH